MNSSHAKFESYLNSRFGAERAPYRINIQSAKKETQQEPGLPALVQDTAHLGALVFRPRVLLPISFSQPR